MSREWKPGDVAMVTIDGEAYRAFRQDAIAGHDSDPLWTLEGRVDMVFDHYDRKGRVTAARPLVVIDPEDREQVERLSRLLDAEFSSRGWANQGTPDPDVVDAVQAALRLVTDPKPEEPQGLGAVVEDADGKRWVLAYTGGASDLIRWRSAGWEGYYRHWESISAVRVLSAGWSE